MKNKENNNELELHQSPEEEFSADAEFESCECQEDDIETIHLDEEDFQNHENSKTDEENVELDIDEKKKKGKGLKKSRKKASKVVPSEDALHERSVFSMVFGLLSCSVFFGNPVFALLGIGFSLSAKKYKYKSVFSNVGLFAGLFGLVLSLLIVSVPVAAFLLLVMLIVFLGLLELLLLLVAVILMLIVNPIINLLAEFLLGVAVPATLLVI